MEKSGIWKIKQFHKLIFFKWNVVEMYEKLIKTDFAELCIILIILKWGFQIINAVIVCVYVCVGVSP